MAGAGRRAVAQGVVTAAVLVTGIVVSATHGSDSASSDTAPVPMPTVTVTLSPTPSSSPTSTGSPTPAISPTPTSSPSDPASPSPPPSKPPSHQRAAGKPLSQALAKPPAGWRITYPEVPLSLSTLSGEYRNPSEVLGDLKFDGYQTGVKQAERGSHLGVVEELWKFSRVTGAAAWFTLFTTANQPGGNDLVQRAFAIGAHGRGYLAGKIDPSGYHYGVGVQRVGTVIVHSRVFSIAPVTQHQVAQQLRRDVAALVATGRVRGGTGGKSGSDDSTTTA